jgi:urocanate hydratase
MAAVLEVLCSGLRLDPLPPPRKRDETLPHAPIRNHSLTVREQRVSIHPAFSGVTSPLCFQYLIEYLFIYFIYLCSNTTLLHCI